MNVGIKLSAAALATVISVGASHAATFTFSNAPAVQGPSLTQSQGGLTLTITGFDYTPNGTLGSALSLGNQNDVSIDNQGLGVCDGLSPVGGPYVSCGQPLVDAIANNGGPEVAVFSFSRAVNILSVVFNQNDNGDDIDIFGGSPLALILRDTTSLGGGPNDDDIDVSALLKGVTSFAVGVYDQGSNGRNGDQVRIASIEYELAAVPLPAAGWLMIAGIGGLAALRRKRKAA